MTKIRSHKGEIELEEFFERVKDFHGFLAPGVAMGGFMVDWALEVMEGSDLLDAVVETRKCLPDAVQLLTQCSIGNSWLRILDWGKLALTLYDKESLTGARVYLDLKKLERFPGIKVWSMKEKPKKEVPLESLIEEMVQAGRDMLTCQKVVIGQIPDRLSFYGRPRVCARCGEAFRYSSGDLCQSCLEPILKTN